MLPKDIVNLITDFVWSREVWVIKMRVHTELRSFFLRRWFNYHLRLVFTHLLPP